MADSSKTEDEASDDLVYTEMADTSRPRALAVTATDMPKDQSVEDSDSCNSAEHLEFLKVDENEQFGTKDGLNASDVKQKVDSWVNINPNVFEAQEFESPFDVSSTSPSIGNSLAIKMGWSSPFDGDDANQVGKSNNPNSCSGFDDTGKRVYLLNYARGGPHIPGIRTYVM